MTNRTIYSLAVAVFATVSTAAQAQTALDVGDPIRVTTADGVLTGRLAATEGDTLFIELGPPGPVPRMLFHRVAYDEIESADIRVPHSRWRGAAIGAGVAAGVVTVTTLGLVGYTMYTGDEWGSAFTMAIGAVALIPSAAVGAAIGALVPGTRWETVSPGRLSLSPVALGRGGGGIRLRVQL
ncbi:hypothetical protein RQM47_01295 [Rubrivirga sp. S365]|uniref:hypothetical protein n=1 Tax=Rubrivirga sp. S365 TaxID=3076080 RepID=UPI0028C78055|nr:hypothetical protein [Rubrivirga sp. S365]MDT7855271.1 hypothetical protein [Rubrivirga sp. S365]